MTSEEICWLDAAAIAERIRARDLSPVEVLEAHLERVEEINPILNAVVTVNGSAREQAKRAEDAVRRRDPLGPLHGVPFTVKDSFDVAALRATRGSLLFAEHIPEADATAVARLRDAGGVLLGKTNVPEFVLWAETENRVFGATANPWDLNRTPGGSSGGEAAAIAAGLSPLGVGSDLSGSIRLPAHYCGIVGLKPTHGRVPLTGHWPGTLRRFSHVGPLARSVRDATLALKVMEGSDGRDCYAAAVPPHTPVIRPADELRVSWVAGTAFGPLEDSVAAAVAAAAAALGEVAASVEEVRVPSLDEHDYDLLTLSLYGAEGAPFFDSVIGGRSELLHPVLRERLQQRDYTLADYVAAEAIVEHLRMDLVRVFQDYDVLLCPVAPVTAPLLGQPHVTVGGEQRRARSVLRATIPFDLALLPAASVPFSRSPQGLPVGVQIVGRPFEDHVVLKVGERLVEFGEPPGRPYPHAAG